MHQQARHLDALAATIAPTEQDSATFVQIPIVFNRVLQTLQWDILALRMALGLPRSGPIVPDGRRDDDVPPELDDDQDMEDEDHNDG